MYIKVVMKSNKGITIIAQSFFIIDNTNASSIGPIINKE